MFDQIKNTFQFLTTDLGFELISEEFDDHKYIGAYVVIYRNDEAKLQLEFSADQHWFDCEIRRLIDGIPVPYSDKKQVINFNGLAILESNNNYNPSDYVVTGNSLAVVLQNVSQLLKRNKLILTTAQWLDADRLKKLQIDAMIEKFGLPPTIPTQRLDYFKEVKIQAAHFLRQKGFELIFDNSEQPPYAHNSLTERVIFNRNNVNIEIGAEDWRDGMHIYHIWVNRVDKLEIDFYKMQNTLANIELTIQKLVELTA